MHVTIRWYAGASALAEAMSAKASEVKELVSTVPGFIAYYAVRDGDNMTSVTVCQDKTGTDESTRRARAWVQENVPQGVAAPKISEGDTFISF
jgi:heme-degrading monooxygenase HmoA